MSFINKINKYLLEHYPLVWNTRLFWMITVSILTHLLFFTIGYLIVNNIEDLKEQYKLSQYFYESSAVYYNFLISIVILLIWIVFYIRNNAFKNLYRLSKGTLFKQFCIILFIFFISITQYYSFKQGLIIKVKSLYDWQEVDADIKTLNKTGVFFTQNENDYKIDNKKYPKPFPLNVAISNKKLNIDKVDTLKAYINYKGSFYQFYKIDKDDKSDREEYSSFPQNYLVEQDFIEEILLRNVVDVARFKALLHPSLLNYSKELFSTGQDSLAYEAQLKYHQITLKNADDSEIKKELKIFISLVNKYDVEHNLEVETWFKLINNKPNYLVPELINTSNPLDIDLINNRYNRVANNNVNSEIPYSKTLYLSFNKTDNFFKNVHESYFPDFDSELLYFLIVFAFVLAILLFLFKTTDVKTLLLSFVASLVVFILIIWLMSSSIVSIGSGNIRTYFVMLFVSFTIILLSFISYVLKWKKIVISVFWSLGLFAFPSFIFFSILYYIEYLKQAHLNLYPKEYSYVSEFEIWFGDYGFYSIILLWILTIYYYAVFVRKLKARPE